MIMIGAKIRVFGAKIESNVFLALVSRQGGTVRLKLPGIYLCRVCIIRIFFYFFFVW